jgi:type IV pilus assembly protein PilW
VSSSQLHRPESMESRLINASVRRARFDSEHGFTLVELMVSMTIGLFVVGVASVMLLSAKSGYVSQSDSAQILDTGRHAIEILTRTVRQASYLSWDSSETVTTIETEGAAVFGMDAKSLKARTDGISSPVARSINGSDVLAVRFGGSGPGSNGDGATVNCAGFGVGTGSAKNQDQRGWSVFYVAEDAAGEPELYCKYPGEEGWAAQAIARGVESFQVLYGLDMDGDSYPNILVNASTIDAMGKDEMARQALWKSVVEVKVAVLVRGTNPVQDDMRNRYFDLFGESYSSAQGGHDKGVHIVVSELPKTVTNRSRKVFSSTIWLRNRPSGK